MYNDENDYELLYLIQEDNEDAKEIVYEKYRPMVEMKAKRFFSQIRNNGYELNDLIQEGMMGLSQAIKDYKDDKNIKFITFASVCIERQMLSFIRDVTRNKHQVLNSSISIDQASNATGRTLLDVLNDNNTANPEESFILLEEQEELKNRIKKNLSAREQEVFDLRFEGFSYQEIAVLLNTTPKSVDGTISRIKQKISNYKKDID